MRHDSPRTQGDTGPYFVLSFDLELAWGVLNENMGVLAFLERNKTHSREPIDFLLRTLEKHDIASTWAVVGHLFLRSCEKENGIPHANMARFTADWYSRDPCTDIERDPLFYGRDIVERILSNPVKHEIGYHSFSHVVFSRCPREVARAEIDVAKEIAKEFDISLKSFVFPRNEVGHVDLLKEAGFTVYRGPDISRWKGNQSYLTRKMNAAADRLLISPTSPILRKDIWEIPTCLHFRNDRKPFNSFWQAKVGIRRAIEQRKVFSMYLHPWDLLVCPPLKKDLDSLLSMVSEWRDRGELSVVTLGELPTLLGTGQ